VPVLAAPPATPFTSQVTAVLDDPATVTLNPLVAPARSAALAGETVTVMPEPEGGALEPPELELDVVGGLAAPVQPASQAASSDTTKNKCGHAILRNLAIRKHAKLAVRKP